MYVFVGFDIFFGETIYFLQNPDHIKKTFYMLPKVLVSNLP